jgi:hypothetical protein
LAVHESLDLDRFAALPIQLMLPFRVPRLFPVLTDEAARPQHLPDAQAEADQEDDAHSNSARRVTRAAPASFG